MTFDTDDTPNPFAQDLGAENWIAPTLAQQDTILRAAQEFIERRAENSMQSLVKEFRNCASAFRGRARFDAAYSSSIMGLYVEKIIAFVDLYAARAELMSFTAAVSGNTPNRQTVQGIDITTAPSNDDQDALAESIEEHIDFTLTLLAQNDDGTTKTNTNRRLAAHVRERAEEFSMIRMHGVSCRYPADMFERFDMHNDLHKKLFHALRCCAAIILRELKTDLGYYGLVYDTGDTPRNTNTDNSPAGNRAAFTQRDLTRNLALYDKLSASLRETARVMRPQAPDNRHTQHLQ